MSIIRESLKCMSLPAAPSEVISHHKETPKIEVTLVIDARCHIKTSKRFILVKAILFPVVHGWM